MWIVCAGRKACRCYSTPTGSGSDADLAVLRYQIVTHEPLQPDKLGSVFTFDASGAAGQCGTLYVAANYEEMATFRQSRADVNLAR